MHDRGTSSVREFSFTKKLKFLIKQESPPAWTQEAHHRRVASTRCAALSNPDLVGLWVGGGVPSPRSRGVPGPRSRGEYLVPGLRGGTWSQVWGVPGPRLEGTLVPGGTQSQVQGDLVIGLGRGEYPIPGLGGTPSQVWGGSHSDLVGEGGTPGTPQTWDGVPPLPRPGMGYPLPIPGMGWPPT